MAILGTVAVLRDATYEHNGERIALKADETYSLEEGVRTWDEDTNRRKVTEPVLEQLRLRPMWTAAGAVPISRGVLDGLLGQGIIRLTD